MNYNRFKILRYLVTIAQSSGVDFAPDPKIMRDDDDEIVRAERNLINFMNEVGVIKEFFLGFALNLTEFT